MAVSHSLEHQTGWSIEKFVRSAHEFDPRPVGRRRRRLRRARLLGGLTFGALTDWSCSSGATLSYVRVTVGPMIVLVVHSKLNNGPCRRSGNRNGGRLQLVELPQATPLLVVPDRSGWRCWLGVGETARRGPSTSGSYRFHPRPSAHRDRSRLGHQRGLRSSCRSSSASSVYVSNTGTSGFVLYARVSRPAARVVLESAGARLPATHPRAHLGAGELRPGWPRYLVSQRWWWCRVGAGRTSRS
jgi:hypothetical protein